jgi:GT2 family glycosyltransferase
VVGLDGIPQYAHRGNFSTSKGQIVLSEADADMPQEITYASFVGLLIKGSAIEQAGYPLEEFFIWFDDIEYCQRLKKFGPIYYDPSSQILHKDNSINPKKDLRLLWAPPQTPGAMQWKFLCGFRNRIYLMITHGNKGIFWALWVLFKKITRILLIDEKKFKLIKFYFLYWKQGVGLAPFHTIKPAEWNSMK